VDNRLLSIFYQHIVEEEQRLSKMPHTDRKRVTFEEPVFIDIVETVDEKEEAEYLLSRPRGFRKIVLWALAGVFLVFLLGGSHSKFIPGSCKE
jgi:hypothetical protein